MKILKPTPVTDATLVSSTIAEDDYPAWDVATTYAAGAFVISVATHTIYRSLTADNLGNDPDLEQAALADPLIADPAIIEWQVIGATDRWKLFDSKPSQRATEADNITVVVAPGAFISGVAGFGISAASVTVTMEDDGIERRNRLGFTEAFDNDAWSRSSNLSVSANTTTAPDGNTTADTLNKTSGTFISAFQQVSSTIGTTYTASVYLKQGTATQTQLRLLGSGGVGTLASLIISWSNPSLTGEDVGGGWYRFSLTGVAVDGQVGFFIYPASTGAGLGTVHAWGAQLEEGPLTDYQFVTDATTFDKRVYSKTLAMQDETAVIDWSTYFFEPVLELSEFVFTDLPPYSAGEVTVSLDRLGGNVSVGQVLMGPVWNAGIALIGGTGFSGLDFSFVQNDDFGNLTTVRREATRLSTFDVFLPATQMLSFDTRMRSLRGGVPAVWIGSDDNRKAAVNYGILRDYRTFYQTPDYSNITIETQGIV